MSKYYQIRYNLPNDFINSDTEGIETALTKGTNVLELINTNLKVEPSVYTKVTIQTLPGVQFNVGGTGNICIGSTGHYEILNQNKDFNLTTLYFDSSYSISKNGFYLLMEIEFE